MQLSTLSMQSPVDRPRLHWLLAAISGILALLVVTTPAASQASHALSLAAQPQASCDLCSILPPGFDFRTTQQGGGEGTDFDCTGNYSAANVSISRAATIQVATDYVLQFQNHPDYRPISAYGEVAYEAPESATKGYDLAFKRGAIYIHIYTSLIGDNFANANKAREYAQYVDSHLGEILGSCPPLSIPEPTSTTIPASDLPTSTSTTVATATATAIPLQNDDLCALLKPSVGDEPVTISPGVGQSGASTSCIMYYAESVSNPKFGDIIISKRDSPETAQKEVDTNSQSESWGVKPWRPTSSYGDPGHGYEAPERPNPDPDPRVNGKPLAASLMFARGCYVASGYAGGKGQALDPTIMRAILASVDQALQQPPFSLCGAATTASLDLTVGHIEVVQVVQDERNNAQIYAGKETLVRVFVGVQGATTPVTNVEVELRAFPAGNDVGIVIPARNSPFTAPLNPSRAVLSDTVNFDLPADLLTPGTYPIKVTINPNKTISETTYDNNALTGQLIFVEPFNLRIGYVRIGYTPPGSANVVWPTGPLQTYTSTLVNIYPTNGTQLQYYELPNRLVYTGTLAGIDDKVALRDWLRERYNRLRSRRGEMAPDLVVGYLGWIGSGPTHVFTDAVGVAEIGTKEGELNKFAGGPAPTPTAITANSNLLGRVGWVIDYNGGGGPDSSPRVLAHEVGHILTLHHPGTDDTGPLGNPSPCWSRTINHFPGYWPRGTGQIWEIGYDRVTRNLRPDTDFDIMNYCAANVNWISMLHYNRLFDAMRRYNLDDPDYLKPDLELDDVVVSGSIRKDGSSGSLAPIYRNTSSVSGSGSLNQVSNYAIRNTQYFALPSMMAGRGAGLHSPPSQQGQGENCLRFTGPDGAAISEYCFDVSFSEVETGQELDEARFSFRILYPQGANGVVLARNGKELDRRTPGSNRPQLGITSPKGGDTWDGSQAISWTASDPDGDKLTYEVHYSPTGGDDWFPLELGLQDTQYTVNTADIAGGDKVFLRVFASDGFNTSRADVGPIKIPNSPPWEPPARPGSNAPVNPPTNPGSGSGSGTDGWVLALFGLGLGLLIGVGLVGVVVLMRRSRAMQGQGPMGYGYPPYQQPQPGSYVSTPPANLPPTQAPQQPRVPTPPPRTPPMSSTPQMPQMPRSPGVSSVPFMPGNPFSSAEKEYTRLRGEVAAGRMNPQQFEAAVRQIRVADVQGRAWMLDPQSGRWLMYDGRAWVSGRPY